MALNVKSTTSGQSASGFVSVRHASATGGQKRLIRVGPAANDNASPHLRWMGWLTTLVALAAVVALAAMV